MPSRTWRNWHARPDRDLELPSGATDGGSVLLQVLFLSVLGLVISSMLLSGLLLEARSMRRAREAPQVSYAAESGVHRTIQHLVNAVSEEKGAIDQFRVLAAVWNRPAPFTGKVGQVRYEARVVDVSPNLAFRAYVRKYADVTVEAEARQDGLPAQLIRATYRLRLGPTGTGRPRAARLLWQKS